MFRVYKNRYANVEERDSETKELVFRSVVHGPFWSWKHFPWRWEVFYEFGVPRYKRGWCLTFNRAKDKAGTNVIGRRP